ncbi:MAG: helix-turn-helix domain-containing protein [Geminicoccaceae bacterium]
MSQTRVLRELGIAGRGLFAHEIAAATGIESRVLSNFLTRLVARGLVSRVGFGHYELTEAGQEAHRDQVVIGAGPWRGERTAVRERPRRSLRARAWQMLRRVRKASVPELLELLDAPDAAHGVERYVRALAAGGYLRRLPVRYPGTHPNSRGHVRWLLVHDTGPQAPVWRASRNELHDPNTGNVRPLEPSARSDPERATPCPI